MDSTAAAKQMRDQITFNSQSGQGKGSAWRKNLSREKYRNNYDKIFRKKKNENNNSNSPVSRDK